jgi:hypothetical protein
MNYENPETVQKSVRIQKDLFEVITDEAKKDNRDFTKQLNYIVRQYYEMRKLLNIR